MSSYAEFIAGKQYRHLDAGFDSADLPDQMMDFQRDCVAWACRRGRAAIFADTGLGKTFMQLAWAAQVERETNRPVLVAAPLCVAQQTVREGDKFGIQSKYMREPGFSNPRIHVTNYEMLKNFDPADYAGIVLDESSILKGMDGRMRKQITEFASTIPYRLSCTATPSPNDFMELGTQAEFLGIMTQVEMLAQFFIHDGGDTSKWRLKGHARSRFWEWLATWSILIRHPADLGYSAEGYDLPPLRFVDHVVETGDNDGLFVKVAQGLQERNSARRQSVDFRVEKAAEIANTMTGPVLVWCHLNDESAKLAELIDGAVQVQGADDRRHKEMAVLWFGGEDSIRAENGKLLEVDTCRGSLSMPKTGEKSQSQTLSTGRAGEISLVEPRSKTKNTCASTTKKTQTDTNEPQISKQSTIGGGAKSTRQTRNTEKRPSEQQLTTGQAILKKDLQPESKSMGLSHPTSTKCLKGRAEGAPYVARDTQDAPSKRDCTLTTATAQELSGDCSAKTATRQSESSGIARTCSERPPNTSKILISKPRIFGYGLNFQHCNQMIFVGLSDSWESFYQAVRRCWRFGQQREVTVHIVTADTEGAVLENIQRKQRQNDEMRREMALVMRDLTVAEINGAKHERTDYRPSQKLEIPTWMS